MIDKEQLVADLENATNNPVAVERVILKLKGGAYEAAEAPAVAVEQAVSTVAVEVRAAK